MIERTLGEHDSQDEATIISPDGGNGTAPVDEQIQSKDCEDKPRGENEKSIGQFVHEGIWQGLTEENFPDVPEEVLMLHGIAARQRYEELLHSVLSGLKQSPSLTTPEKAEWADARRQIEEIIEYAEEMRLGQVMSFISKFGKKSR